MRNDKIIPGVVLVLIGAAILLGNFGYLHFHWYNIFHLWPIFLVIAGVNLVFAHNKSVWATAVKIGVIVLGVGMLFFGNFGDRYNFWPRNHYSYWNNDNDDDDDNNNNSDDNDNDDDDNNQSDIKMNGRGAFNMPYDAGIKLAHLNISGGGTSFSLIDTTNQLFNASTKDDGRYDLTSSKEDSIFVVNFKMKDHNGFNFDSNKNEADMRINQSPIWDVNVETGAAKIDFDLSKFKIRTLKLHGGAASFNVKLGVPLAYTDVDISTGVSGVDISIPQNAACSIETDSGLSDNHFEGFNKTRDNNYETPGFAAAKNKLHIHISGGLSDFKVSRY